MSRTKIRSTDQIGLVETYTNSITQLIPLASKARGPRTGDSMFHKASEEYNRLVSEYLSLGGMLQDLADSLGVTYHTLRRRAHNTDAPITRAPNSKRTADEYPKIISKLNQARAISVPAYHQQILEAYENGYSLNRIAKMMNIKSPYPLYYGLRAAQERRTAEGT